MRASRYHQKIASCSLHREMSMCLLTPWLIGFVWIHYLTQTLYRNPPPATQCHSQPHLFRCVSFSPDKDDVTLAAHNARPTSGIVSQNAAVKREKVINLTPRCEYSSHCLVGFDGPHLEAIVSEKGRQYLAQCHWDMWLAWPHPRACQLIQQELNGLWVSGTLQSFLTTATAQSTGVFCGFTLVSDTYGRSKWDQMKSKAEAQLVIN